MADRLDRAPLAERSPFAAEFPRAECDRGDRQAGHSKFYVVHGAFLSDAAVRSCSPSPIARAVPCRAAVRAYSQSRRPTEELGECATGNEWAAQSSWRLLSSSCA